ncbi:MAG: hypothetical protein ACKO5Q_03510 [Microcystaceae cyanobacterium]
MRSPLKPQVKKRSQLSPSPHKKRSPLKPQVKKRSQLSPSPHKKRSPLKHQEAIALSLHLTRSDRSLNPK